MKIVNNLEHSTTIDIDIHFSANLCKSVIEKPAGIQDRFDKKNELLLLIWKKVKGLQAGVALKPKKSN